MRLSVGQAWQETRAVLTRDGGLIATVALALLVLPGVLVGLAAPAGSQAATSGGLGWLFILSTIFAFVGQIAISRIALGPALTVGQAISVGFRRIFSFVLSWMLWLFPFLILMSLVLGASGADLQALATPGAAPPQLGLGVNLALLALIVGVLVVAIHMIMLVPAAADTKLGPVGLVKRSWQLSRGRALKLFGIMLLAGVLFLVLVVGLGGAINSVVLLLLGPGQSWSISALLLAVVEGVLSAAVSIVSTVLIARCYAQLAGEGASTATVPHAGHH